MKRDLAAARQRARLHCKMIEDQRRRADAAADEAKPQNAPTPETTLESLEAIRELWTRAQNLRISLNVGISHDHAENALVWMGKALDKAAKVWPQIAEPTAEADVEAPLAASQPSGN